MTMVSAKLKVGPKLSAIMIVRDGERFIAEAIESVKKQSFKDWELIVVDDGSSDSTPEIVSRFVKEDTRVRMIVHPGGNNRGMSASRNLGLSEARGDFIAFLDADDVWLADKCESQIAILEGNPSLGMTYGRVEIWHSWSAAQGAEDHFRPLGVTPDAPYDPPALLPLLLTGHFQTPTTCGAMMRASAIRQVGGFADRFQGLYEDRVFFARMFCTFSCQVDSRSFARYRQHNLSATAGRHGTFLSQVAFLQFLAATRSFLRQQATPNPDAISLITGAITQSRRDLAKMAVRQIVPGRLARMLKRHWGKEN